MIAHAFTSVTSRNLIHCAKRIDACLDKLTAEQIWNRASEEENAIGNLVLHLCGNLRQYTRHGILGEPDIRTRDEEFNARDGASLRERLQNAVAEGVAIIAGVSEARLAEEVTVQNRQITILEAILKTTIHFAEHTGQILYATKLLTHQELGFVTHKKRGA